MRIAQVVTYISDDGAFGGPVAVALAQCVELARRGHSVHLYAAWDGVARVNAPGVTLHLFRIAAPRFGLAAIFSIRLLLTLRRRIARFDVVHLHFGRDLHSVLAWISARAAAKVILQPHGMVMPDGRLRAIIVDRLIVRRALRSASSVLSLTGVETEGLRAVAAGPTVIERIDNGVFVPEQVDVERPQPQEVLFLARLHPRKQVLVFAEAARRLLKSGSSARFRVVGPDEGDLQSLQAFIARYGLTSGLQYGGAVGPGAGVHELSRAAIYVLPSTGEVYPMTVLEALTVGTPVVLSSDCALRSVLAPADAARVVDPTPDQIAAAIADLLGDEDKRRALGRRGHEFARTRFSIEAVAERLEGLYSTKAPPVSRVAITQPYVPEYRGALWEKVITRLAEHGVEARVFWGGSHATVEAASARGDLTTPTWSERVPTWELPWSRVHPPFSFRRLPRAWRRPDLLLTEMQATNANAWASAFFRRPFVTMGHGASGTTTNTRLANITESLQNKLASHVLAYTPAGRDAVIALTHLGRNHVTSFDNATDTDRLRRRINDVTTQDVAEFREVHGIPGSSRIAMYLGALEPYKRIDLLEAAARLVLPSDPGWHLVVAGDGSERFRLERLSSDTGRVTLLGRVGPESYAPAARVAAVLLNPGRIGLVAVDALTMGTRMLTTDGAEHAPEFSYLERNRDVISVPATPEDFATAWRSMDQSPQTTARESPLSADHSAEVIANTLLDVLQPDRRR